MHSSPPSHSSPPPPPPPPSFEGYGRRARARARARALLVVAPLVLVSFMVLAADSYSSASWFSPHALFISPGNGAVDGSGHDASDGGVAVGNSTLKSCNAPFNVSLLPPTTSPLAHSADDESSTSMVLKQSTRRSTRDVKLERLERGLAKARAAIREALQMNTTTTFDKDYVPRGPIYRNARAFHRSYLEMEKLFKVHVYEEGEPPLFHDGPSRSIYSSEGRFIHGMELDDHFRTTNPDLPHVHFLPFSLVKLLAYTYVRKTRDHAPLTRIIADYIDLVAERYPFWNRSLGADHFFLSCHDWGPYVSKTVPLLYKNSIRVMCNANTSEGFVPSKDVTLPEINILNDDLVGMVGGPPPSQRPILAFFAGGNHGPVRPLLVKEWKGKDEDVQVHEYLPKGASSYLDYMRKSKFCLCPSGYEVASPRIVEAVYVGCVPVTINSHYALPFSDVLDWKAFSVDVPLEDIPNLKKILTSIPEREYLKMQKRVELLRRHFMLHGAPQRFDMYHMILHSIWLRRLNIRIHPRD